MKSNVGDERVLKVKRRRIQEKGGKNHGWKLKFLDSIGDKKVLPALTPVINLLKA